MPPKAKPGARTEALFSIWRQTEGTFKAWPGDGKTAHSGIQSRLFLTSWRGLKMNSRVSTGGSGGLSRLVGQGPVAGRPQAVLSVCKAGFRGGRGQPCCQFGAVGGGGPHPWEPRDPGIGRTPRGVSNTRTHRAGEHQSDNCLPHPRAVGLEPSSMIKTPLVR